MTDFPRSLIEFQQRFGDEAACAQYLAAARWPDGFVCPRCGGGKAWRLETKAWTYECASCGRQTSVTAGTIMHHSKLPLTAWFWAAYLMATHSNGISALQLQRQLAFGSYKTAWLLCASCAAACSLRTAARWPASSRLMKPRSPAAVKTIRSAAVAVAAITARSLSSAPSKSKATVLGPDASAWTKCPITRPAACMPSSPPT